MGGRGGTAGRELPGAPARRVPRVQRPRVGAVLVGVPGVRHDAGHARRRRQPRPRLGARNARAHLDRRRRLLRPPRDLVDDLRWCVRTPSRPPPGDHRVAGGVVDPHHGRARLHLAVAGRLERRAPGTGPAPAERVLRVERVRGRELPRTVRGGARRRRGIRVAAALGIRLSAHRRNVAVPGRRRRRAHHACRAAQHVLRDPRRRPRARCSARTRCACTGSTRRSWPTSRSRIAAPTLDDLAVPIESVPAGAAPTAFRTFGAWK